MAILSAIAGYDMRRSIFFFQIQNFKQNVNDPHNSN